MPCFRLRQLAAALSGALLIGVLPAAAAASVQFAILPPPELPDSIGLLAAALVVAGIAWRRLRRGEKR